MAADKKKAVDAHNKGQKDSNRFAKDPNPLQAITEAFNPSYRPPAGYQKEYRKGWKGADKGRKSGK